MRVFLEYILGILIAVVSKKIQVFVSIDIEFVFYPCQLCRLHKSAYKWNRHKKHWLHQMDMEVTRDKVANLPRTLLLPGTPIQIVIFDPIEVQLIWLHNNLVGPNHLLISQMLIEITSSYVLSKTYRLVLEPRAPKDANSFTTWKPYIALYVS